MEIIRGLIIKVDTGYAIVWILFALAGIAAIKRRDPNAKARGFEVKPIYRQQ